jgi:hypothetical protein
LYEAYGVDACTALLFCLDDSTHPNALGGTLVARLCAQAMVAQNILSSSVRASTDVLVNPSSNDFGKAYVGQTLTKEFTLSGFDLTPASGVFNVTASEGFGLSNTPNGTFSTNMVKSYTGGNLDFTRFYVSVKLTEPGIREGTLTISNGSVTKTVPLTATAIRLAGGTDVKLSWNLAATADYVLAGPATAIPESFNQMLVSSYAAPKSGVDANGAYYTVWPASSGYTDRKTQRNVVEGLTWPAGEIDEVSTRYIQFGITANRGTTLNLDSIGLYVGGAGGSGMRCRIAWSKNRFSDRTAIAEYTSMTANTMYAVSAIPIVSLAEGDTLLLRIYPWYSGTATGKTICLADVTFHGVAVSTTAVDSRKTTKFQAIVKDGFVRLEGVTDACRTTLYDMTGKVVSTHVFDANSQRTFALPNQNGVYICEVKTSNQTRKLKLILR